MKRGVYFNIASTQEVPVLETQLQLVDKKIQSNSDDEGRILLAKSRFLTDISEIMGIKIEIEWPSLANKSV